MSALTQLGDAIELAIDKHPAADVLSILLGAIVGLTLELARRAGHDTNLPMTIDGGPNRDITISAPKARASAAREGAQG